MRLKPKQIKMDKFLEGPMIYNMNYKHLEEELQPWNKEQMKPMSLVKKCTFMKLNLIR